MAGHAVHGAALAALACFTVGESLAQTAEDSPFVDTKSLQMHAKAGPPPVMPMKDLLTAPAENQFKQERVPKTAGSAETVSESARPVKLSVGYEGAGDIKTTAAQTALRDALGFVMAGARYDDATTYKDGNGDKVGFGYTRDTEQLVAGWTPNADTILKIAAVRDYIGDDLQPHFSQDVLSTERIVGKAQLSRKNAFGVLERLDANLAIKDVSRQADNYSLRPYGAQKALVDIDRRSYDAGVTAAFKTGAALNTVGIDAGYDQHDAERVHQAPWVNAISAYRFPDVKTRSAGLFADTALPVAETSRVRAGLRYDYNNSKAGDLDKAGTTGNAVLDRTPSDLYQRYYGTTGDEVTDHALSGRLRWEQDLMADNLTAFADLARMVRIPDNIERWHSVSGTGSQSWVGNPGLDPERHHKLSLGGAYKTDSFLEYGRMRPDSGPSIRLGASAYYDKVKDFVTGDRARGQDGILQSDGAIVYRNVDATLAGAELDGQWNLTRNWSTRLNLAYTWGQNTSDSRALYQIAPFEANWLVDYTDYLGSVGTWNAGGRLRMVAAQTRVDSDQSTGFGADTAGQSSAFAVLDLYAGLQFNDRVAFSAGIDNLLDQTYAEHLAGAHVESPDRTVVNAPGRSFHMRGLVNF
jgi:iron complex outermembrane receptor protein